MIKNIIHTMLVYKKIKRSVSCMANLLLGGTFIIITTAEMCTNKKKNYKLYTRIKNQSDLVQEDQKQTAIHFDCNKETKKENQNDSTLATSRKWMIQEWVKDHTKDFVILSESTINEVYDAIKNENWGCSELTFILNELKKLFECSSPQSFKKQTQNYEEVIHNKLKRKAFAIIIKAHQLIANAREQDDPLNAFKKAKELIHTDNKLLTEYDFDEIINLFIKNKECMRKEIKKSFGLIHLSYGEDTKALTLDDHTLGEMGILEQLEKGRVHFENKSNQITKLIKKRFNLNEKSTKNTKVNIQIVTNKANLTPQRDYKDCTFSQVGSNIAQKIETFCQSYLDDLKKEIQDKYGKMTLHDFLCCNAKISSIEMHNKIENIYNELDRMINNLPAYIDQ